MSAGRALKCRHPVQILHRLSQKANLLPQSKQEYAWTAKDISNAQQELAGDRGLSESIDGQCRHLRASQQRKTVQLLLSLFSVLLLEHGFSSAALEYPPIQDFHGPRSS